MYRGEGDNTIYNVQYQLIYIAPVVIVTHVLSKQRPIFPVRLTLDIMKVFYHDNHRATQSDLRVGVTLLGKLIDCIMYIFLKR